ncbi:uncharacterized protein LOC135116272 [Scylla paramamosain]|uniref:uncharacterized protein LOC135116272 n=1 Tax=Scylla paramamosain TaxID=85552 RepID=UPI0030838BDA
MHGDLLSNGLLIYMHKLHALILDAAVSHMAVSAEHRPAVVFFTQLAVAQRGCGDGRSTQHWRGGGQRGGGGSLPRPLPPSSTRALRTGHARRGAGGGGVRAGSLGRCDRTSPVQAVPGEATAARQKEQEDILPVPQRTPRVQKPQRGQRAEEDVWLYPRRACGTIDIYGLRSQAIPPACHHTLLVFCQAVYSAYNVFYLIILLVWFCCISCESIVRGHANLPPVPRPIPKLSPEFDDGYKHPPGWAWLCWLCGVAGLICMFLALPMLEIGIIYLGICSPHSIVPGWLLGQGAISMACLAILFPIYCLPLKLGTKLLASLHLVACILAVMVVVWPPLGLLSVLAGWRERQDIILNTSGYCDPEFQLFTVVVAAILSLPLTCLLYAACLLLIAVAIVGTGILLFWGCCDEGISSDVGIVTHTHAKSCLSSAKCNGHTTRLTSWRGSGSGGEEWGYDGQSTGTLPMQNGDHL